MSETSPTVKIGTSRQVVIPKKIHDRLGLAPGDYLQVELEGTRVVFTPKTLLDKDIGARLAEALEDVRHGRVAGPFRSAKAMIRALHRTKPVRRR
jgi:AbrB family looped-hinge helix DNA binding protein